MLTSNTDEYVMDIHIRTAGSFLNGFLDRSDGIDDVRHPPGHAKRLGLSVTQDVDLPEFIATADNRTNFGCTDVKSYYDLVFHCAGQYHFNAVGVPFVCYRPL